MNTATSSKKRVLTDEQREQYNARRRKVPTNLNTITFPIAGGKSLTLKRNSQNGKIIEYLLTEGNTLTTAEAYEKFKIFRFGARISELRELGVNIKSDTVSSPQNPSIKYNRYWIDRKGEQQSIFNAKVIEGSSASEGEVKAAWSVVSDKLFTGETE